MEKITKECLVDIERQMYNKARDIDVAVYNTLFSTDMPKDFVLDCLAMYQNRDGGFGNALEIDNYNPNSSVFQVYEALKIMYLVGFTKNDKEELFQSILKKTMN